MSLLKYQFIKVNDIQIAYHDAGTGPPLLLIHGFPENLQAWRKNVPGLSKHFRVIALDIMGFGRSEHVEKDFSAFALGDFIKDFLKALQISKTHVVATDTGASVALGFTTRHPEKIDRLILFSGTAYSNSVCALDVNIMMTPILGDLFFPLFAKPGLRLGIRKGYHDSSVLDVEALNEYLDCLSTFKSRKLAIKLMRDLERTASEPLAILKKNAPPCLILWAQYEKYFHSWVPQKLKEDIAGSQLKYIQNSGHFIQEEKPEEFHQEIITFLSQARI